MCLEGQGAAMRAQNGLQWWPFHEQLSSHNCLLVYLCTRGLQLSACQQWHSPA